MGNDQDSASKAAARASQVSDHLNGSEQTANTSRRRRRDKKKDDLPADYSDILSQIDQLKIIANTPDHSRRGYVRQKQDGKLWVRERIEKLLDPQSFSEIGSITGTVKWKQLENGREEIESYQPHNNVQGYGRLNGRQIVFTADDFSIRAGHQDGHLMAKTLHTEKLSISMKIPMIKLTDGSSGGGSISTIATTGFSYVPPMSGFDVVTKQLNMGIPNLGAVLGPAIGLGAARVVSCHFTWPPCSLKTLSRKPLETEKNPP